MWDEQRASDVQVRKALAPEEAAVRRVVARAMSADRRHRRWLVRAAVVGLMTAAAAAFVLSDGTEPDAVLTGEGSVVTIEAGTSVETLRREPPSGGLVVIVKKGAGE